MRTPRGAVRARCGRTLSALAVLAGRCAALSRGLPRSAAGVWMSRSMADRKAASVLPDPVGAMTSAFSPRRIAVQARAWTDVGPSGKAEANQARVAGAKPFSAVPVTPAGPAGPGDSAGLAGPDAPDDPACSASPGDPAGPDDSGGPPGSVLAGSAGSPLLAVRALMPSPAFLIVPSSCARLAHGSHPTSALHAACSLQPAARISLSQPPLSTAPQSLHRRCRVGIRKAELRQRGSGPFHRETRADEPDRRIRYRSSCSPREARPGFPVAPTRARRRPPPRGSTPAALSGAQRPTVRLLVRFLARLLLQGDPNSPHRGITYR